MTMLQIYHVTGTRGMRVIWLCEELHLPYRVTKIDFSAEYRATPQWRKLNPVGKVPVMVDGEITMFESGAMVQYLLDRYAAGKLRPAIDDPAYAHYLQWLWFAEATLSRPLGEIVNHRREFPGQQERPEVIEEMKARAASALRAVADHLVGRTYLVNDTFSGADIMLGYAVGLGHALVPEGMPAHLEDYWLRLQDRPAFQIANRA